MSEKITNMSSAKEMMDEIERLNNCNKSCQEELFKFCETVLLLKSKIEKALKIGSDDNLYERHEALKKVTVGLRKEISDLTHEKNNLIKRVKLAEKCMANSYSIPSGNNGLASVKDNELKKYSKEYPNSIILELKEVNIGDCE